MTRAIARLLAATALAATGLAAAVPAAAQGTCDRQCLIDTADRYAQGLIDDNPAAVRWATGALVMENLARVQPGEGAWDAITGDGDDTYVIHVPDPVTQQVGFLRMMQEGESPVLVGVRLKLDASGAVSEAEHLIARNLSPAQIANLQAPRPALLTPVTQDYADSRGRLLFLGRSYYNALDNGNSRQSNMADDCERRENGFQTARNPMIRSVNTGNGQRDPIFAYLGGLGCAAQMDTNMWEYISRIESRRVDIADPVTGLVWGMSHFEHDFTKKDFNLIGVPGASVRHMDYNAFDMPAIHIYKVWGGAIHEIEALGIVVPADSPHAFSTDDD
jgi:hypothetical protein